MGIDSLYYWVTTMMLTTLCCWSHYAPYDGNFHRPQNKHVKKRRKDDAAKAKAAKAAAKASEKAEELAHRVSLDHMEDEARRQRPEFEVYESFYEEAAPGRRVRERSWERKRRFELYDDDDYEEYEEEAPRPVMKKTKQRSATPGPGVAKKFGWEGHEDFDEYDEYAEYEEAGRPVMRKTKQRHPTPGPGPRRKSKRERELSAPSDFDEEYGVRRRSRVPAKKGQAGGRRGGQRQVPDFSETIDRDDILV